ncbi:MAG: hypothetical protein V9G98_27280 [Candidatus Competibacter sp.]
MLWTNRFNTSCSKARVWGRFGSYQATALGAGRSPLAVRAPVTFRADLDQYRPAKHRQVAQADRPVNPVNPVKLPAAVMTLGCSQRTFHFDQQGGIRQFPAGQHPHIGQIQGQANRDRHRQQSKRGEKPPQLFILGLLMPYHKMLWSSREIS